MKAAVCVVVRDEQDMILEWIAYHVTIGFDTVAIFDNRSTDATRRVAQAAGRHADVRLFDWPFSYPRRQSDAYLTACREFATEFDWVALIDADEFLLPMRHAGVKAWLAQPQFEAANAIAVCWAMFGSAGHETPPAGLVMANYLQRAWDGHGPNRHTKAIVRPEAVRAMGNPHAAEVAGRTVDVLGADMQWDGRPGLAKQGVGLEVCRLNHYFTRSRADWARRLARGQVTTRTWDDFAAYDRNETRDEAILRHAPRTRALMARLAGGAKATKASAR